MFRNLSLLKFLLEDLKHPLPHEYQKKIIRSGNAEALKYLEENHNAGIKDSIIKELESNKKRSSKMFTYLVEKGTIAMLSYFFDELKSYPSFDQLNFHLNYIRDSPDTFFSKAYLFSVVNKNPEHQKTFKLLAYRNFYELNDKILKEIFDSKTSTFFKAQIASIMRDKIACYYLGCTFKAFKIPEEISYNIASYTNLCYPFHSKM